MSKSSLYKILFISLFSLSANMAFGMHIAEGFLPSGWCVTWYLAALPFVVYGLFSVKKLIHETPKAKIMIGIAGGFVFVLSALKLPSVTGSCSHLTGTGLGALLFGPWIMSIIGLAALLFQALLLAHGGITTLGANVFSMAIAGPILAYTIYLICKKLSIRNHIAIFIAAMLGDLFTYLITSGQLALAYPDPSGGFWVSMAKFGSMFAFTQLPLAIVEGFVTVYAYNLIVTYGAFEPIEVKALSIRSKMLIGGLAILLVCSPFAMKFFSSMSGTDDKAIDLITSLKPDYKPWINSLGLRLSDGTEPLMFSVQIAIGLAVIGGFWILLRRTQKSRV